MGGHYGSIQVRSEDYDRVKAAADAVAVKMKIHCLIRPAKKGWISIFPEGNGQDERVGQALARKLPDDILQLLVHDDDIFAYWLYREHKLADSFHSSPGYFGEENRAVEEKMAGNPEAFRPILGEKISVLPPLLAREKEFGPFAHVQMEKFAKALGIKASVNAYEYLKSGEGTGIKSSRRFEEIPAMEVIKERAEKKRQRTQKRDEKKRWRDEGLLLAEDERENEVVYACPMGNGHFVVRPDHHTSTAECFFYGEPWNGLQPPKLEMPAKAHIIGCSSDGNGKRVAVHLHNGVDVWEATDGRWKQVANVTEKNGINGAVISADGKQVAYACDNDVVAMPLGGPKSRVLGANGEFRQLAFHPSGDYVVSTSQRALGLIALREAPQWRDLYVGGKSKAALFQELIFKTKMGDLNLDELAKRQSAALEAAIKRIEETQGKSKESQKLARKRIEDLRNAMTKIAEKQRENWAALKTGQLPAQPPRANETASCAGFSRNGRWLWCGTNSGLRVFNWSSIPKEHGADLLNPVWGFQPPNSGEQLRSSNYVYCVAEEVDEPAIVFGGINGRLYRLDLLKGKLSEVLKLGDGVWAIGLSMSVDGKSLGIATRNGALRSRVWTWQVWSYPKLREAVKE